MGEAEKRFEEDALRILRTLRFAAVLGFSVEPRTDAALRVKAPLLRCIAPERILTEMDKLLCGSHVLPVLLNWPDVLAIFLPEIAPCVGFERQNERVVPVYAQEGRNEAAHFLSTCVQHHALQFVRDFHDTFAGTGVMQSLDNPGVQLAMSLPFEGALRQLPEADAELLRKLFGGFLVLVGLSEIILKGLKQSKPDG